MKEVTSDVYICSEFPRRYLNAYVVDDVLVDAGTRWWGRRLLRNLRNHELQAHVLTHAHPDHQGMTAKVCGRFDIPVLCHEEEREVVETGDTFSPMPQNRMNRALRTLSAGSGCPVDDTLTEGDEIGGFEVVETPGNAPGHISLWRESDGTVILGDVLANISFVTARYGLRELPRRFTADPEQSIESARKIANLEPDTVCFGHGPPLHDGDAFQDFVNSLLEQRRR